ncbi:hypothetical protein ACP70R_000915 [Stipagrostis hirtigluma subsp. patula]
MLPSYPTNNARHHHHHHPLPNPTVAAFLMPATTSWDEYGGQIFPADMYSQDTLEAVLRQPVTTAPPRRTAAAAAAEREPRDGAPVDGRWRGTAAAAAPRKRPVRTDRHSKIRTAQGVRDRRMRLSVGVARDFFALQDRLGFDKASKTVNWLLTQSKPAIDRLSDAPAPAAKEKAGEGSSSSTGCFRDAKSSGGLDGSVALMAEHGGGENEWIMSGTAAAAVATEQPQPMDGLEYYYQYYQLEEMMRSCSSNGGLPR